MKRFMCMFLAVILCLGLAGGLTGCKEEKSSPSAETEQTTPPVEKPIPSESPIPPPERQP
jgi:hypothetical protein